MTKDEKLMFLEEYKICQQKAQSLEGPIWQTSSIMGLGSIGALLVIVTKSGNIDLLLVIGVGVFVNLFAWIWYKMAGRLWSIQHTALMRLYHLECKQKEFYLERYIKRRDARAIPHGMCEQQQKRWEKKSDKIDLQGLSDYYKSQVDEVHKFFDGFARYGTRYWSKWALGLNAVAWALYFCWIFWVEKVETLCRAKIKIGAEVAGLGVLGVLFLYYLIYSIKQIHKSDCLKKE